MTPLQVHCQQWKGGCGAEACDKAQHVVLGKGGIPCDILFIGEAPGRIEDEFGQPFIGPAGEVLDRIIAESVPAHYRKAFTNLVGCIPLIPEEVEGAPPKKANQPSDAQIKSCGRRLIDFVRIASPRLIVCVGSLSRDWTDPKRRGRIALPERCPECKGIQFHTRSGWTCPKGHGGLTGEPIPSVDIVHPAWILRQNIAVQGNSEYRAGTILINAIEDHLE